MKKVVKFGGSSLASAEQFKKVGDIIRSDESRRYVVPSAPGKRFDGDIKVTDMLYECYRAAEKGEKVAGKIKKIQARYQEIIDGLGLDLKLDEQFADIDRDTFLTKRENSIFVQYSSSHISQFPEFFVCNCLNDGRIVYDTRICYQHTGNIGPVFIQICMDRFCNDRSRYIRTSTGKCLHTSIMERSIKSRDYCMIDSFQSFSSFL